MKMYPPFFIGARLAPALHVGDATLSLIRVESSPPEPMLERWKPRDRATLVLDFPDGTSYEDDRMQSGMGGFRGTVDVFESFLGYLEAAVESFRYEQRTGNEGENTNLFPRHIVEWADAQPYLDCVRCDLTDEDGYVLEHLITD